MTDALCGGFCLGLAVLFKQSYAAAALAVGLWLLFHLKIQRLAVVVAAAILPVVTVFGLLLHRHEPVVQEAALFRSTKVILSSGISLIKNDFFAFPSQGILLVLALVGIWVVLSESSIRGRLLGIYFLIAWGVAIPLSAAPGSSTNAFLEVWTIAALLVPFAVKKLLEDWSSASPTFRASLLLLLLWNFGLGLDAWRTQLSIGKRAGFGEVAHALRGREYLSDNSFLAAQAKTPQILDPSVNHYLELAGRWSPQPVIDELNQQTFDVVALGLDKGHLLQWRGYTLFSPSILQAVKRNYELSCLTPRLAVLMPRGDPHRNRDEILAQLSEAACRTPDQTTSTPPVFTNSAQP